MKFTIEKDDAPDDYAFFTQMMNEKDYQELYKCSKRLSNLTQKKEKVVFCFQKNYGLVVVESNIEKTNDNFIIQYITPFFNIILEGKCIRDKVLMGLYDYSIMTGEKNYPLFNEQLMVATPIKQNFLKVHQSHHGFNRQFLMDNEIAPLYITQEQADLCRFNSI